MKLIYLKNNVALDLHAFLVKCVFVSFSILAFLTRHTNRGETNQILGAFKPSSIFLQMPPELSFFSVYLHTRMLTLGISRSKRAVWHSGAPLETFQKQTKSRMENIDFILEKIQAYCKCYNKIDHIVQ